jgi:hypothetical protein
LILKKIDQNGPFQLFPWHSVGGDISPPASELMYITEEGVPKLGHSIYIGTIQFPTGPQFPDSLTVATACGLTSKSMNFRPLPFASALAERPHLPIATILVEN